MYVSLRKQQREIARTVHRLHGWFDRRADAAERLEATSLRLVAALALRLEGVPETIVDVLWSGPYAPMTRAFVVDETLLVPRAGEPRSLLADYLAVRGGRERPLGRRYLRALEAADAALWEVLAVEPGRSVDVRPLEGERKVLRVSERMASEGLVPGEHLYARVVPMPAGRVFSGGVLPLPLDPASPIPASAEGLAEEVFARWAVAVVDELASEGPLPEPGAPPGDPERLDPRATERLTRALDEHLRLALDEPVPMLGNRTPRECAAGDAAAQAAAIAWLDGIAAVPGVDYDASGLWAELGLARQRPRADPGDASASASRGAGGRPNDGHGDAGGGERSDTDRKRLLARVRKLFAMAQETDASPHEAEIALRRCQSLMARFGISEAELETSAFGREGIGARRNVPMHMKYLGGAVARLHDVLFVTGGAEPEFRGYEIDARVARLTLDYLMDAVERALSARRRRGDFPPGRSAAYDYRVAFAVEVAERVRTIVAEREAAERAASPVGGSALSVRKRAIVERECGQDLVMRTSRARGAREPEAAAAGQEDGARVSLEPQVEGEGTVARLGVD